MKITQLLKQVARLCGILVFLYILSGIDLQNLLAVTFGIHPFFTLIIILSVLPITLLRAVRWKVIAEGLDLRLKLSDATGALCLASLANLIIPGSFGDLVRVPYMQHRGNRVDKSIISILVDSFLGAIVPYIVGILAITLILEVDISVELLLIIATWCGGGYLVYRLIKATLWSRFTQARLQRLMKDGIRGRMFFTFPSMLKSIGKNRILGGLGLSIVLFLLSVTQAYILAIALNITIDWTYLAISLGLSTVVSSIPVTIQGIGIREGVLLFMLIPLGIEPVTIVSFSLTIMILNILPAVVGLAVWAKNPFIDVANQEVIAGETSVIPNLDLEIDYIDSEISDWN